LDAFGFTFCSKVKLIGSFGLICERTKRMVHFKNQNHYDIYLKTLLVRKGYANSLFGAF